MLMCYMCWCVTCVGVLHVLMCYMCWCVTCVGVLHVLVCYMCWCVTCVGVLHVSACYMRQYISIGVLQASQMKTLIEAFLIETDKVQATGYIHNNVAICYHSNYKT